MFLAFSGKGGFPWQHAYDLPVRVRKMAVAKLIEIIEAEKDAAKGNKGEVPEKGKIYGPSGVSRNIPASKPGAPITPRVLPKK